MPRYVIAQLLLCTLGALAACGPKEIQGVVIASLDGNTANPNTPASNPNVPVTNPNVANPNTKTPPTQPVTPSKGLCGTSATAMTYAAHVKPLITLKCSSCHQSGGNSPTMETFAQAKTAFSTGEALEQVDAGQMPQGSPLTDNQLCVFDTWAKTSYGP